MVNVLLFRFQQCCAPTTMLLFEASSKTELFRLLSNHVFQSPRVQKYKSYEGHPFLQNIQNEI